MNIKSQLSEKRHRHWNIILPEHHTCSIQTAYNKEQNLFLFNEYNIKATSNSLFTYQQLPRLQRFKINS
jgi:hypothetical protein